MSSPQRLLLQVSIPKTVSGGLQLQAAIRRADPTWEVSIPKTVSGGLQPTESDTTDLVSEMFQYRRRYREGYNQQQCHLLKDCFCKFQYRRRYREGYNYRPQSVVQTRLGRFQYRRRYREGYNVDDVDLVDGEYHVVSIPKTVSGGLQLYGRPILFYLLGFQYRRRYREGYNTTSAVTMVLQLPLFQYRRRYREGYNSRTESIIGQPSSRFNTEDGIGRATTRCRRTFFPRMRLLFQYRRRYREGYNVGRKRGLLCLT